MAWQVMYSLSCYWKEERNESNKTCKTISMKTSSPPISHQIWRAWLQRSTLRGTEVNGNMRIMKWEGEETEWKVRRQLWIEKRLGRGLKLRRPRRGLETKGSVFEKFFGRRFPETWNEAYTCHIFHKDFSSLSFRPKRSHCLNNSLLDSSNPRYKQSLKRVIFNSLTMV